MNINKKYQKNEYIETSYSYSNEQDSCLAGKSAATAALGGIKKFPVKIAFVFASAACDLERLMSGVCGVVDEEIVIGATTAGAIAGKTLMGGALVILIASDQITMRCATGCGLNGNWEAAYNNALSGDTLSRYFNSERDKIIDSLILDGVSLCSVLFTSGNRRNFNSRVSEIVGRFNEDTNNAIPLIGACAADDMGMDRGMMEDNYILHGRKALKDSMLIAVIETKIKIGIGFAHGFITAGNTSTVTRARGREVFEIDGIPAASVVVGMLGSGAEAKTCKNLAEEFTRPFGFETIYGNYNLNAAVSVTENGGILFAHPVAEGSRINLMEGGLKNLRAAGLRAVQRAFMRGGITRPSCAIYFSSAQRGRIPGHEVDFEIDLIRHSIHGMPVLGFMSFGEQGVSDDGINRHNDDSAAVIVFGDELTDMARVAERNRELTDELGLTISRLNETVDEKNKLNTMIELQRSLAVELSLSDEINRSLAIIMYTICLLDEFDAGGAYIVNQASGDLELAHHYNLSEDFINNTNRYPLGSPQYDLIERGDNIYINYPDLLNSPNSATDIKFREGIKSVAIIPLKSENRLIGALNIASRTIETISENSKLFLESISGYVSNILKRAGDLSRIKIMQENFINLFGSINDMIVIAGLDGKILHINKAYTGHTGYTYEEMISMTIIDLHPPELRDEAIETVAAMMRGETDICKIPIMKKDKSLIPVETHIAHGYWNNEKAIYGISRDITERKEFEEQMKKSLDEKGFLLREVNHRVKNNMQIISSLISLQVDGIGDTAAASALTDIQKRVHSMALIHEMLYQTKNFDKINFKDYIDQLTQYLLSSMSGCYSAADIDIAADADDNVRLSINKAVPCGLLINELMTNSIKHAFKGMTEGVIKISITESGGMIHIGYSDNGIGVPEDLKTFSRLHAGLGFMLIDTLVKQLKGSIEYNSGPGFSVSVKFPA